MSESRYAPAPAMESIWYGLSQLGPSFSSDGFLVAGKTFLSTSFLGAYWCRCTHWLYDLASSCWYRAMATRARSRHSSSKSISKASIMSLWPVSKALDWRVGKPISKGIIASLPKHSANGVSLVDLLGVVRWAYSIVSSSLTHLPLAFSKCFLIPSMITLLEASCRGPTRL